MFKVIRFLILSLVSIVMISCNNPRSAEIPVDTESWKSDVKFTKSLEKLTDDDKSVLMAYLMRISMGKVFGQSEGLKKGMTIGDAIKAEKDFQAEQVKEEAKSKALAAELQKQQAELVKHMNDAITTSLVDIKLRESDWESGRYTDDFLIQIGFKNNTPNAVTGISGTMVFGDIFGNELKRVGIAYDDGLDANATITYTCSVEYNQFIDDDTRLAQTNLEKLKYRWEPSVYMFEDGSELRMPE